MEKETFRHRLFALLQKSRQAFRLYSSVGRSPRGQTAEFSEMQAVEWRNMNAELIAQLSSFMDRSVNNRELVAHTLRVRERFYNDYRLAEGELHNRQKELILCAERGDFVKASVMSRELISLKARIQACQAVYHEVDDLVMRGQIAESTISLTSDRVIEEEKPLKVAKVIPLRKW